MSIANPFYDGEQLVQHQKSASRLKKPRIGRSLLAEQQTFIATADTFFVASVHPTRGVDASHRGGNPGFVRVLDDRTLRIL